MVYVAPLLIGLSARALAASGEAPLAPAVIVWTEPALPSAEVQGKVAHLTGGGHQETWGEVAYATGDRTQADRTAMDAVKTAEEAGRKHWDEFDVELGIAQALRTTIDGVSLVGSDADRDALSHALALEATAVMRAFPETKFATSEDASLFRVVIGDMVTSRPLADLVALDPDHVWTREELGDGQILARIQSYQAAVKALPLATAHFGATPPGVTLLLDGRDLPANTAEVPVWPGHHYAAVRVGTRLAGRFEFDAATGARVDIPSLLNAVDIEQGKGLVLGGDLTNLAPDFGAALGAVLPVGGKAPRVYLAAVDDKGKGHVLPWSPGATLIRPKPLSMMLMGDVGGGFYNSTSFAQKYGTARTTVQFGPQLSGQFGIYNFFISAGGTVAITPAERFASGGSEEEKAAEGPSYQPDLIPAGVRAWGGIGAYLPRPTRGVPLLSVGINYGMFFPGSTGFGGSLAFGAPVSDGKTWVRFSLDGFRTVQMPLWPEPGSPSYAGAFRIGFGRLL